MYSQGGNGSLWSHISNGFLAPDADGDKDDDGEAISGCSEMFWILRPAQDPNLRFNNATARCTVTRGRRRCRSSLAREIG